MGCPEFRSRIGKKRGVEKGQSKDLVEQFDGNEDDGNAEESSERELCTIALSNPSPKEEKRWISMEKMRIWCGCTEITRKSFFCYRYSCLNLF